MKDDQRQFLALCGQPPARFTVEQVAWVLNCQAHDIAPLVVARLLKPLGNPTPNAVKYFSSKDILELAGDASWLSRVTNALQQYWQRKNAARKNVELHGAETGLERRNGSKRAAL